MPSPTDPIKARFQRFATEEARGVSATYKRYAQSVASSTDLLTKLAALPSAKQQPNLLFAATRLAAGLAPEGTDFARHVLEAWPKIASVVMARDTQTNEPGRCACLLPALAQIEGPLAILEVGAAAGLCLLPDHYGYAFGAHVLPASSESAPIFPCEANTHTPLPHRHPKIVWRAGLDINPLDVTNAADMNWLRTLVWPEQTQRRARLDQAIAVAQRLRPRVIAGDLLADTAALASEAPKDATLVIFHTAVLKYVDMATRRAFADMVADLGATWLANEGVRVLPRTGLSDRPDAFVLSQNGRPIARTGPHGQYIDWLWT